jgi:hypothetical protein
MKIAVLTIVVLLGSIIALSVCFGTDVCTNNKYDLYPYSVGSTNEAATYIYVTGTVYDASSIFNPLTISNAIILGLDGATSRTDVNGTYIIYVATSYASVSINVQCEGHASTKVFIQYNPLISAYFIPVYLNKISYSVSFDSKVGVKVSLNNSYGVSTSIMVPPSNNSQYSQLTLQLASIPSYGSPGLLESSQDNSTTNSTAMQSLGMFFIDIQDTNGSTILFPEKGVQFSMAMPTLNDSVQIGSVSWYHFNDTSNK